MGKMTVSIHSGLANENFTLKIDVSHDDSAKSIVEKLVKQGLEFGTPDCHDYTIVSDKRQLGQRMIIVDDGDYTTIGLLNEGR